MVDRGVMSSSPMKGRVPGEPCLVSWWCLATAYSMFPVQKADLCSEIHCLLLSVQYKFFLRDIDYYGVMRRQKTQVSYYTQIPCSNEYIICNKAAIVKQNHELYLSFQAAPTSANHSVPVTSFIPKIHMKVYVC